MVGAISGGCLESDIVERSQPLILHNGEPIIVEYDPTASDDLIWGLGMGCNGTVQVLVEIKGKVATSVASRLYLHVKRYGKE